MLERLGNLIEKLQQQYNAGVEKEKLLLTVEMLQRELLLESENVQKPIDQGSVSVILPTQQSYKYVNTETIENKEATDQKAEKLVFDLHLEMDNSLEESEVALPDPDVYTIPTFAYQRERNTFTEEARKHDEQENTIIMITAPSANQLMEDDFSELGAALQKEPVEDLRQAISINDRYQLIYHLFNGDETMYERSIKTINNFNKYAEAEFWIRRELAIKIGWDEKDPLVQQFGQLVKRRFS